MRQFHHINWIVRTFYGLEQNQLEKSFSHLAAIIRSVSHKKGKLTRDKIIMKQLLPLLLVLLVLLWKKVKAVELRYALRSREDTGRHTKETDAVKRDRSSSRPGPRSLNHNADIFSSSREYVKRCSGKAGKKGKGGNGGKGGKGSISNGGNRKRHLYEIPCVKFFDDDDFYIYQDDDEDDYPMTGDDKDDDSVQDDDSVPISTGEDDDDFNGADDDDQDDDDQDDDDNNDDQDDVTVDQDDVIVDQDDVIVDQDADDDLDGDDEEVPSNDGKNITRAQTADDDEEPPSNDGMDRGAAAADDDEEAPSNEGRAVDRSFLFQGGGVIGIPDGGD